MKKFQLDWALQRIKYLSGATNTGAALNYALKEGFQVITIINENLNKIKNF